jgi:hypothetical protein
MVVVASIVLVFIAAFMGARPPDRGSPQVLWAAQPRPERRDAESGGEGLFGVEVALHDDGESTPPDRQMASQPAADEILHAETNWGVTPYWGRNTYPDEDLGFELEMRYPHPYVAISGDPVPGDYVEECVHDETNHLISCTGKFPEGTPGGESAKFTYTAVGTCALYPSPPNQVTFEYDIFWSDGGTQDPTETYNVAPVPDMTMTNPEPADGAQDVPIIALDGSSPILKWAPAQELACNVFPIPDSFDTSYWVSMRRKGGTWQDVGGFGNCGREIPLTPQQLPCADNGEPVTWEWRVNAYDYKYGRCRAENPVETQFAFTAGSCRPEIEVEPEYGNAYFISNIPVDNTYRVEVDWTGSAFQQEPTSPPYGDVTFTLNGEETVLTGEEWGVEHVIDMGSDLNANWNGGNNTLDIYASYTPPATGQEMQSLHYTAQPIVFPLPDWAATFNLGLFDVDLKEGAVTYEDAVSYPKEPFEANVKVPKWVPYVGGRKAGILETQATGSIAASSAGTGKLGVEGKTGLGLGVDVIGQVDGEGKFRFGIGDGLEMTKSSFGLSIRVRFEKVVTLGDLVPGLRAAEEWYGVGWAIKKLNNHAKITGTLIPKISITAFFEQQGRDTWVFTGSVGRGQISAILRGDLKLLEKLYAWAEGGGTPYIDLNFPANPDYLKELGIDFNVNAGFRAWYYEKKFERTINCAWPPGGCREKEDDDLMWMAGGWELVERDYVTADYNVFVGDQAARHGIHAEQPTTETPIVANVFALSEPALAVRDDGSAAGARTLLYIHDDPAKPLGQGMEMMATQWDGLDWGTPVSLTNDLHLDFTPQVVYDGGGNAVALWERSYTSAITEGLTAAFMQSLDIGTATWISATQSWSGVSMLTEDDGRADFAPRLRSAGDGTVMALWETTDGHDMLGSSEHPLTYTTAFWDGAAWSTPVAALAGLTNTLGMDVALYAADQAALVYVWDADVVSTTVGTELFYSLYDGADWGTPQRLTDDVISDTTPSLVYDADGTLKLLWMRGDDLVMLDDSWDLNDLEIVRADSVAAGFLDPTLVRSPEGHLALAWQANHAELSDLAYSIYDAAAGRWGADQHLMQDDALEISTVSAFAADGTLHMAYRKEQTEYFTETVVFSPTLTVTYTNVPRAGASDLYVLEHTVGRDLTIGDLALSPDYPAPGAPVTLTARITNTGDLVAGPVVVQFSDAGTPVVTVTVSSGLTAGVSITATAQWTTPTLLDAPHTLTAVVDPAGAVTEFDETNNTTTLRAFEPQLVAEWARVTPDPQGLLCTLSVTNAGSSPARGPLPVYLRAGDAFTGTLLATGQLTSDLAVGARTVVTAAVSDVTALPAEPFSWMIVGETAEDLSNAWPLELRALPDLTLTARDVRAGGHGDLEMYSQGPVTVTLHNVGPVTATDAALSVWTGGLTNTLVHSTTFPLIAPDVPVTATFNHVPVDSDPPPALWFRLDPDDAIEEWDETNNLAVWSYPPNAGIIYLPLVLRTPAGQ